MSSARTQRLAWSTLVGVVLLMAWTAWIMFGSGIGICVSARDGADDVDASPITCPPERAQAIADNFMANYLYTRCPDDSLTNPLLHAAMGGRSSADMVFMNVGANKGFGVLSLLQHWARGWCESKGINSRSWSRYLSGDCGACDQCLDRVRSAYRTGQASLAPPTILAYEPGVETVRLLNRTLRSLKVGNVVHLQPFAFGNVSAPSTVSFPRCGGGDETCGIGVSHGGVQMVTVPLTSVDLEIARLGLTHVDMLLVDTEGHDPGVLWGAEKAFRKGMVSLVEYEHHYMGLWAKHSHKSVIDYMDGHGFDCWWFGSRHLWRITGCWSPKYELRRWSNVICAHRSHRWRWVLETLSYDP